MTDMEMTNINCIIVARYHNITQKKAEFTIN